MTTIFIFLFVFTLLAVTFTAGYVNGSKAMKAKILKFIDRNDKQALLDEINSWSGK